MGKVYGIQYLRAVAVLFVVLHHVATLFPIGDFRFYQGIVGVDIFFVVSGFIMWVTTTQDTGAWQFFRQRIIRVVPLYWIITLYFSFVNVAQGLDFGFHPSLSDFFRSMFFIPFENSTIENFVMPIVRIGWTLNMEMFFYAIFAVSLFLPQAMRFASVTLVFAVFLGLAYFFGQDAPILQFYGSTIIVEFLLGMGLGVLYKRGAIPTTVYILPIAIVIFVVKLAFFQEIIGDRLLDLGIISFLLVLGALSFEPYFRKRIIKSALLVGDASYSLYLTHKIAIALAFSATFHGLFPKSALFAWPILIVVSIIGGVICHFLVEKPANRAARALLVRKKK